MTSTTTKAMVSLPRRKKWLRIMPTMPATMELAPSNSVFSALEHPEFNDRVLIRL